MYNVLIVDDEPWALKGIENSFNWQDHSFNVITTTTNPSEALHSILTNQPHVVFSDIRMPNISGLDLLAEARKHQIDCEFIFISGFAEFSYAQEALRKGAYDYLLKPLDLDIANQLLIKLHKFLCKKSKNTDSLNSVQPHVAAPIKCNNKTFNELVSYLQSNIHLNLSLSQLAKQFHLNPNYCCLLFKKQLDCTYSEYVTHLRMQKARQLLLTTNLDISDICSQVGFNDYYYFNKVFKKTFELPPSEYRYLNA